MTSRSLDNLVKIGQLRAEAKAQSEFDGLVRSGMARLTDADTESLSIESRFDLIYNAAHSLSLAALRWHGYRPTNRFIVFQTLAHTLDLPTEDWRVLDRAHTTRNHVEYEGISDVDEQLVAAMLRVTKKIAERLARL
jgi:PIN domain nuclease of toxin-antitoxin system